MKTKGFTLIEVLVALVIIALALATMAVTMGRMLDNASTLRDRTYASWIAQNKIIELRTAGTIPKLGASNGELEYANTDWTWRAVVSETGVENLLRVDVVISHPGVTSVVKTVTGFIGEPIQPGTANGVFLGRAVDNSGVEQ